MNNRILITGALGFGKFFIDSLINQGNYVLATDIKNSNDLNYDFEIFDVHDLKKGDELIKKYKINQYITLRLYFQILINPPPIGFK